MNNRMNNGNKIKDIKKIKETQETNLMLAGIKHLFTGYLITFVMILIYAALLTYTQMNDKYIIFVILITTIMSTTYIGFKYAKMAENKGLLWGLFGGLLYGIMFVLLGYIAQDQYLFSSRSIFVIAFSLIAGAIGGIIGINSKK